MPCSSAASASAGDGEEEGQQLVGGVDSAPHACRNQTALRALLLQETRAGESQGSTSLSRREPLAK